MKEIRMSGKIRTRLFILILIALVFVIFFYVKNIINLKQFQSLMMMSDEEMYFSNSVLKDKQDLIDNFNEQTPNRKYVYIDLGANNGNIS